QKHLGRGDHLPARGMMLATPELVIAERVELLDQIEVAAELQHRVLADRMMRGEEGAELEACHRCSLRACCSWLLDAKLWRGSGQGNRRWMGTPMRYGASAEYGSPGGEPWLLHVQRPDD